MLASAIPLEPLESRYVPLISAKTGSPAKRFRMAVGAVYIQNASE